MAVETLNEALERAAGRPDAGLRFLDTRAEERWMGWPELRERAAEACGALQAAGVEPGGRVALVYPTCPDFVVAFFGALLAGAVPVPLYPPARLGRLEEYRRRTAGMLRRAAPVLVLADARVRRVLGEAGALACAAPSLGCRALAELPRGRGAPQPARPAELALIQFSSGTTVEPKPVALSHRAVMAQAAALNALWPETPEHRQSGLSWLPLYHDMGLVGCVFTALERPGVLTLIPPEVFAARPAAWLRAISRYRATISAAPNFAYALCLERVSDDEMQDVDLSCWRVALNGAEAVAPSVLRAFSERFARWGLAPEALTPVYGLSEACLAVTFSDLHRPFTVACFAREALAAGVARLDSGGVETVSVGRPLPGFEVAIRGAAGRELGADRVGRVWVRGPSLMEGYFGDPEATVGVLRDGWLDTGDLGILHGGELYLTGRAKDLIVLRGKNYRPEEFELAAERAGGVRSGCAAALGFLPEGGAREVLLLLVERRREATPEAAPHIAEACRAAVLAATAVEPDTIEVLAPGTLPRTSSGKIRRQEALRRWRSGDLAAPPRTVTPGGPAGD